MRPFVPPFRAVPDLCSAKPEGTVSCWNGESRRREEQSLQVVSTPLPFTGSYGWRKRSTWRIGSYSSMLARISSPSPRFEGNRQEAPSPAKDERWRQALPRWWRPRRRIGQRHATLPRSLLEHASGCSAALRSAVRQDVVSMRLETRSIQGLAVMCRCASEQHPA